MSSILGFFSAIGEMTWFGMRAISQAFMPPFEWKYFIQQIKDIGEDSVALISAAGFGAEAWIPTLQSASFFNELGPLVTGSMRRKQPYWPDNLVKRHIRPVAKANGIHKRIGWPTFRHSFGTLLKANGEDVDGPGALTASQQQDHA